MGRPKKDSAKSLNKLSKRSLLQVKKVALKKKALKLVKVALKDKKTAHKAIRKAITKFSELKTARKVEKAKKEGKPAPKISRDPVKKESISVAKKVLKKIVISKKKIGKVAGKLTKRAKSLKKEAHRAVHRAIRKFKSLKKCKDDARDAADKMTGKNAKVKHTKKDLKKAFKKVNKSITKMYRGAKMNKWVPADPKEQERDL